MMLAVAMTGALFMGSGVAQAAPLPTTPMTQAAQSPSPAVPTAPEQMTPKEWSALKAGLNSSKDFTRDVKVSAGVRTLTYTSTSGSTLELREPVGPAGGVTSSLGAGGGGFMQLCVYLNKVDQLAPATGGAFVLGAALCLIPAVGQVACIGIGAALAVALVYIGAYGFCSNQLRVRVLPYPGGARCV